LFRHALQVRAFRLKALGLGNTSEEARSKEVFKIFCEAWNRFSWHKPQPTVAEHTFANVFFGLTEPLTPKTADHYYDA